MPSRGKVRVSSGGSQTVRTPGGGSTRVRNGRDGKIDIKITPPKR
jgi:hypothetical protein